MWKLELILGTRHVSLPPTTKVWAAKILRDALAFDLRTVVQILDMVRANQTKTWTITSDALGCSVRLRYLEEMQ